MRPEQLALHRASLRRANDHPPIPPPPDGPPQDFIDRIFDFHEWLQAQPVNSYLAVSSDGGRTHWDLDYDYGDFVNGLQLFLAGQRKLSVDVLPPYRMPSQADPDELTQIITARFDDLRDIPGICAAVCWWATGDPYPRGLYMPLDHMDPWTYIQQALYDDIMLRTYEKHHFPDDHD